MTEKEYQYISTIAEQKNVTKAAEDLFIAQPSLTQALHRIESEYGTKFFHRTSNGMCLTEAGELYLSTAEKVLQGYQEMKQKIEDAGNEAAGKVSIGIEMFQSDFVAAKFLPVCREKHPNMDIRFVESTADRLKKMLEENRLDLALFNQPFVSETLNYIPICQDELVYACAKKEPELRTMANLPKEERFVTSEILGSKPLLMMAHGQQLRTAADMICLAALAEPDICHVSMNSTTLLALASRGYGAVIMPLSVCRFYEEIYPLEYLRIPKSWEIVWQPVVAYNSSGVLPQMLFKVITTIQESIGDI